MLRDRRWPTVAQCSRLKQAWANLALAHSRLTCSQNAIFGDGECGKTDGSMEEHASSPLSQERTQGMFAELMEPFKLTREKSMKKILKSFHGIRTEVTLAE